ncbi:restriction endonuclease subunit S [Helicobacter pylori]|uniref:restriction endonuclease subunit S n=1 Tax=Helicobacter pylori TaxID=210 RepID=UPI000FDF46D0|nr:restriction endonuclease subunit S [Helicobacter pylori]RVY48623.1 restriction endonuclease subunit S [Helicobacter pylori]RVY57353.1 restriction endonuclease subunit S [Helicobacter pylori]RVY98123.1 restriction endonuclease subunit S [Helicobacter pylori]
MIGPLSSQLNAIKWGEFKLGDLFEIEKTLSFNKDALTQGQDYDYITRTSQNQGVLQTTGFVNAENLNPPFTWSLGLLQMDFFYRKKSWYAGQFMRKITPKTEIENKINLRIAHYFTTLLNALKRPLLSVLVRDIDKTFREQKIQLPLKPTAKTQTLEDIDFNFMEKFIAELEQCRLAELQAYLKAAGLENTTLSSDEENALNVFNNSIGGNTPCDLTWQSFRLGDLFEIRPTKAYNLTNSHLFDSNAKNLVVTNSSLNNGISGYSSLEPTEKGNQITYSDTTTSEGIFYQKRPFIGYSHVQGLYPLKYHEFWNEKTLLYIVVAFKKVACGRFNYGNKFNRKIASEMSILLPTTQDGGIDFHFMRTLINALMKQTIQGVAEYCGAKIQAAKEIISQETPVQKDSLF